MKECVCGHRESAHRVRHRYALNDGGGFTLAGVSAGACEYVERARPPIMGAFAIVRFGLEEDLPCRCRQYIARVPISTQRSFDIETRTWVAAHVLPVCPDCGVDELYIDPNRGNARCYVCPFDDWAVRA